MNAVLSAPSVLDQLKPLVSPYIGPFLMQRDIGGRKSALFERGALFLRRIDDSNYYDDSFFTLSDDEIAHMTKPSALTYPWRYMFYFTPVSLQEMPRVGRAQLIDLETVCRALRAGKPLPKHTTSRHGDGYRKFFAAEWHEAVLTRFAPDIAPSAPPPAPPVILAPRLNVPTALYPIDKAIVPYLAENRSRTFTAEEVFEGIGHRFNHDPNSYSGVMSRLSKIHPNIHRRKRNAKRRPFEYWYAE